MLWFGAGNPERYRMLLQEDRIVEWGTVGLFLAAGVFGLRGAIRRRRVFDGLVALFCLFVAAEEMSWGQRLVGYTPPEFFLANNFQQELNLHNLPQWAVQPKWFLMVALAGHGLLLPLLAQVKRLRALTARAGATAPGPSLSLWYATAIALLLWYPLTLTGEWVEALAGGLFLALMGPAPTAFWTTIALTVSLGVAMTPLAGALERGRSLSRAACAATEVQALLDDVVGEGSTRRLWNMRRVHKRIFTSINDGYLDGDHLQHLGAATCADQVGSTVEVRRRYGIDPWGSPYWLLFERAARGEWDVTVYSFGPNRRRDISDPSNAPATGLDVQNDVVEREPGVGEEIPGAPDDVGRGHHRRTGAQAVTVRLIYWSQAGSAPNPGSGSARGAYEV